MTPTDKPARRTVSAQEKAREALGVAERKVKRLEQMRAEHQTAIYSLEPQIAEAKATRDYLAQHPALKGDSINYVGPNVIANDAVTPDAL